MYKMSIDEASCYRGTEREREGEGKLRSSWQHVAKERKEKKK